MQRFDGWLFKIVLAAIFVPEVKCLTPQVGVHDGKITRKGRGGGGGEVGHNIEMHKHLALIAWTTRQSTALSDWLDK